MFMKHNAKTVLLINNLQVGGAERVVITLAEHFNRIDKNNSPSILLLEPLIGYDLPESMNYEALWNKPLSKNKIVRFIQLGMSLGKLLRYIRDRKIQKVVSQLSIVNYLNILAKLLGGRHKCYITLHCAYDFYSQFNVKNIVNKCLIRWLYPKADLIIGVSKDALASYVDRIKSVSNTFCSYNPFDIKKIRELSKNEIKKKVFCDSWATQCCKTSR